MFILEEGVRWNIKLEATQNNKVSMSKPEKRAGLSFVSLNKGLSYLIVI